MWMFYSHYGDGGGQLQLKIAVVIVEWDYCRRTWLIRGNEWEWDCHYTTYERTHTQKKVIKNWNSHLLLHQKHQTKQEETKYRAKILACIDLGERCGFNYGLIRNWRPNPNSNFWCWIGLSQMRNPKKRKKTLNELNMSTPRALLQLTE